MELTKEKATRRNDTELINQVKWLNLPDHLLTLIAEKIVDVEDYVRFGAVCPSWRSVYIENKPKHLLLPLLLIPTKPTRNCPTRSFLSLSSQKVCSYMKFNLQYNFSLNGSTKGWLVAVAKTNTLNDEYTQCIITSKLSLFNPLLSVNDEIELPTLIYIIDRPTEFFSNFEVPKLFLSANPISNPRYTVVAIYGDGSRLAFFKPGNKTWTRLDSNYEAIMDIIFYNEQFYVVNNMGETFAFDLNNHACPKVSAISRAPIPTPTPTPPPSDYCAAAERKYLAELSGDLLQIVRFRDWVGKGVYKTFGFRVFKLDTIRDEWAEMKSLDGHMLFLGDNSSVSLPASHFPQCKPNCIYFTDDYHVGHDLMGPGDMGVFNLKDEKIEPHCYQIFPKQKAPHAIWVVPSL